MAGISPVKVDGRIIELLSFSKEMYTATGGMVNVAMGSVLSIWHDARSAGLEDPSSAVLPDMEALSEAARHTDINDIIIDEEASTVYLADPLMSLDIGAVAKGFAVEKVAESAPEGLLISVGGNVSSTGVKPDGTSWVVGLQDPEGKVGVNVHTVYLDKGAVVTSGSYQRYYVVDGISYNHIIDPETLMPGNRWLSVSVLTEDSGVADALSTALFLLDYEDGLALLEAFDAEAIWTAADRSEYFSPGFKERMRT